MSPMKKARCYFGSMLDFLNKKIFIFGGSNATKSLSDIELYNIESDTWTPVGLSLPEKVYAFSQR